jgi:hypothetical protein
LISSRPSSTIRCACLGWASLVRFGHFQRKTYRWFLMRARCFRVAVGLGEDGAHGIEPERGLLGNPAK